MDTKMTLSTMNNGEVEALFQRELAKIQENIIDPSTKSITSRAISLTMTFAPDPDRAEIKIIVSSKVKLADCEVSLENAYFDSEGMLFQPDDVQQMLPDDAEKLRDNLKLLSKKTLKSMERTRTVQNAGKELLRKSS